MIKRFLPLFASLTLGVVAIAVMLKAPKGIWGLIAGWFGWQLFPLERRLVYEAAAKSSKTG